MGQLVIMGIACIHTFSKADAARAFNSLAEAKEAVQNYCAPLSLYDVSENENAVIYQLKPQLLETEVVDFVRAFYTLRIGTLTLTDRETVEDLQKLHKAKEIVDMAKDKTYEFFQYDEFWEPMVVNGNKWRSALTVRSTGIDLSLDGKIIIECSRGLLPFIERMLRKELQHFQLAATLRVVLAD